MTIAFKVSDNVKQKMIKYYEDMKIDKTPAYALFQVKDFDCVTTLYESGKVVFQGIGADIEASVWIQQEKILNNRIIDTKKDDKKDKDKDAMDDIKLVYSTIGSDEVGTGDFFGPIVVSAAYVSKEKINFLIDLGVRDSKKITDEKIIAIAPSIIKEIPHSTIVFDNKTYNSNYSSDVNMNKIKAILHNKVLLNLVRDDKYEYKSVVVDQFCLPKKFYEYIVDTKEKVKNIYFMTKAEDKCYSVAAASIISRYIFLKEMKRMSQEMGMEIPKGAGPGVDAVAKIVVEKFGINKLNDIAKTNFKNMDKIKNT